MTAGTPPLEQLPDIVGIPFVLYVNTCSRANTPRGNVETPSVFQTSFLEAMLGELGRLSCHVWKLATEPSPPHSADGSSAADKAPGGFSAAGLWKAPPDGPLTREARER